MAVCIAVLLGLAGCARRPASETAPGAGSPTAPSPAGEKVVTVELAEYTLQASPGSVQQGSVRFVAYNRGSLDHELVIVRTDLPFDQLPVSREDTVEEGDQVQVVAEIEPDELRPGNSAATTVRLAEGRYALICNIAGHYRLGMRQSFTVTS